MHRSSRISTVKPHRGERGPHYWKVIEIVRANWKALRHTRGLTQRQLADALGTSQQSINKFEREHEDIPLDRIIDAFAAMGGTIQAAFVPGAYSQR